MSSTTGHWSDGLNHRFDYYRATVYVDAQTFIDQALIDLEPAFGMLTVEETKKERFYDRGCAIFNASGDAVVRILFSTQSASCNVRVAGSKSDIVARLIRSFSHSPSRVDVRVDGHAPDLWKRVVRHSKAFADKHSLKRVVYTNDGELNGDTVYLGARTSQCFLRLYQKGLKEAKDLGLDDESISEEMKGAVRFELEFKPQCQTAKDFAAKARPVEFWGSSDPMAAYARALLRVDAQRYVCTDRRPSDYQRALKHMGKQYSKHLEKLLEECAGDTCEFGERVLMLAGLLVAGDEIEPTEKAD